MTHIYLLMGCALPPTLSFIMFDGGLLTNEWTTIILSGVLFLGVGDVAAALYGRKHGKSKWRVGSSKTVEGSLVCFIGLAVFYYGVNSMISPFSNYYFISYFISSWIVAAVEAFTDQYDNLVCSLVYFITLLHTIEMFNAI